jgi:hypothetical protein
MACTKIPPAVLRLPVALLALALVTAAPADDPDAGRADVPSTVSGRTDVLIHEPPKPPSVPADVTGQRQ